MTNRLNMIQNNRWTFLEGFHSIRKRTNKLQQQIQFKILNKLRWQYIPICYRPCQLQTSLHLHLKQNPYNPASLADILQITAYQICMCVLINLKCTIAKNSRRQSLYQRKQHHKEDNYRQQWNEHRIIITRYSNISLQLNFPWKLKI